MDGWQVLLNVLFHLTEIGLGLLELLRRSGFIEAAKDTVPNCPVEPVCVKTKREVLREYPVIREHRVFPPKYLSYEVGSR
jgi:hypothetical protein